MVVRGFLLYRAAMRRFVPVVACAMFALLVGAAPATTPASPVTVRHVVRADPPTSMFVVAVDLSDRRASLHVAMAGADPDGDGPYQTTLQPVSEIAARERFAVAVNGDFFAAAGVPDGPGRHAGFARGKPASAVGPTVCDGRRVAVNATTRPALQVSADGHVTIALVPAGATLPADVTQSVGGSGLLVVDGRAVPQPPARLVIRHPRTAVGLTRDRSRLILLVVDGHHPGTAAGMTGDELATELVGVGCDVAMNLDGGGSTTLAARDGDRVRVVNQPSDGPERPVADALGVRFDGPVAVVP